MSAEREVAARWTVTVEYTDGATRTYTADQVRTESVQWRLDLSGQPSKLIPMVSVRVLDMMES